VASPAASGARSRLRPPEVLSWRMAGGRDRAGGSLRTVPGFDHHDPGLRDVAARAGVSLSTVSRVVTGRTQVSDRLKQRVLAAVAELGYRPNAAAQALVSGRRSSIAVMARNTTRFGYAGTLQGIEEAASAAGYAVMIAVVESDDPARISAAVDQVLSHSVAGVIVIEFDDVGRATLEAVPDSLPVVAAAGAPSVERTRPHVYLDDDLGGRIATEYLLSLGHRTVHHVSIPSTRPDSGRSRGWRRALEAVGAEVPDEVPALYSPESGYGAAQSLLDDPSVTAILCGNDELAIGVARALAERGRKVPEEVSVVGFDDQPFARMWLPALTTVAQDFTELGRHAFALLEQWLRTGAVPADAVIEPRLVLRESSVPPSLG